MQIYAWMEAEEKERRFEAAVKVKEQETMTYPRYVYRQQGSTVIVEFWYDAEHKFTAKLQR